MSDIKMIPASELREIAAAIFMGRGVSERDSGIVADSLVHANLRGTDSHGVMRIPHYIQRLNKASINARPQSVTTFSGLSTGHIDGDHGFGHVTVWDAMGLAMDLARDTGVGFVGVNHSNHCGALSYFAYRAMEAGMIAFVFSQTDAGVVPYGGRRPFCGSNPLCFGFPTREGSPVVLDMATSTVAGGHVFKARMENRPIPPTWALDEEGNPTTDPHKAVFWTPAAGAKGYGLGVVIDLLTGLLCGGTYGPNVPVMYGDLEKKRNLCHLVGALDYQRFPGGGSFLQQAAAMVSAIHAVPPAEGFDMVKAPGEPEHICSIQRVKNGIPVSQELFDELQSLLPSNS